MPNMPRMVLAVTSILILGVLQPAKANGVPEQIEAQVGAIAAKQVTDLNGIDLSSSAFIAELYALRDHRPLWSSPAARQMLLDEVMAAEEHGFRPEDFALDALIALSAGALPTAPEALASFDIAATEVMARLLQHIYLGKVDPQSLDANWSFDRPYTADDPAALVNSSLETGSLSALIEQIEITHPAYRRLQDALAQHRDIARAGGWPAVPEGNVLKPGDEDVRIPTLRDRLHISGDYDTTQTESLLYDADLEAAVRAFQTRHGLEADGVIGPKTYRALNTPVETRIDQLRASLERARWLFRDLSGDYVFVNIGGPETFLVQDGEVVWRARSIVGRAYRQTPVFRDEIQYMEFNPTWTVPVSIFRRDKLSQIRRDLNYLSRGGYTVLDSSGRPINPRSVNWSGTPNVTLRQEPGPKNALGQVKFMFPNAYSVYLHDTDDRSLFSRNERNLSSGCVRVENPFEFADLLLKDDPDWSAARREAILASGKTTRVTLPAPIPVLLTYFTAWMDNSGTVQFREDIYERDPAVLRALNALPGNV